MYFWKTFMNKLTSTSANVKIFRARRDVESLANENAELSNKDDGMNPISNRI